MRNIGKDIKRVFIVLFIGVFLFTQNAFALYYREDKTTETFFKSDVSDAFQTAAIVALVNMVGGGIAGASGSLAVTVLCPIISGAGQVGGQIAIAAGADPHTTMIVSGVLVGAACGVVGGIAAGWSTAGVIASSTAGAAIGGTVAEAGYQMQQAGWNSWLSAAATLALGAALSFGANYAIGKAEAASSTSSASQSSTTKTTPIVPTDGEVPPMAQPGGTATEAAAAQAAEPAPTQAPTPAAPSASENAPLVSAAPEGATAQSAIRTPGELAAEPAAPTPGATSLTESSPLSRPMTGDAGTGTGRSTLAKLEMEYLTADLPRAQMEGLSPAKAGSSPSSSKTFMQDLKDRGLMLTKGIDDKFAWQYDSFWGGLGKVMLKQLSPGSVLNYALKGLAYELTKDKSENEKLLGAALASAASGIGGYYLNEAIGTSWAGNLKNNKGEIYNPYHRDESNVFKNVWARNILDAAAGAALDKIILETGQPQLTTLAKSALAWGASSVLLEAKTALGTYLAYDPTHDPKYLKDFLPPTYSFGQATTDSFIKSLALWYPLPQNVNGGGVGVYVKRQMKFWGLDNIKLLEAAKRNGGQVLYNNYILPEFSDFLRDEAAGNFVSSLLGPDGKESRAMKYWGDVPSTGSRVEAIKGIGISGK